MKVIFIRHGKTEYNEQKKYCGSLDPSLSEHGRVELETADVRGFLKTERPDFLFCSPMRRTQETAELLFSDLDPCPVVLDESLREIDFGVFEGRSYEEMKDDPEYTAWLDTNCEGLIPGGDFPESFREDVAAGFEQILETCREERARNVVIISHGGVIGSILERYVSPKKHWYDYRIPCGGFVVAEGEYELTVTTLGGGTTC